MINQAWFLLLGAYLLGSIPSAYLIVRVTIGEDIRYFGDGNVGAKNAYESVGKLIGFSIAAADIGKGFLAVTAARNLGFSEGLVLLAGGCVVLGHDFSIFLGFQGGQGMAATVGVFGALFPLVTLLAFISFLILLALTRNWDLSCGIAFFLLVVGVWLSGYPTKQILFSMLLLPWIALSKLIQSWRTRRFSV
ncbi:MAG: glycerol-3-phosphate acyltransferase [Anaerolineales bacterium]